MPGFNGLEHQASGWTSICQGRNTSLTKATEHVKNKLHTTLIRPPSPRPYPTAIPLLEVDALLFTENNGNELNFWGNADGSYTLGGNFERWQNFDVTIGFGGTIITPIPEPVNVALGISGGIFLVVILYLRAPRPNTSERG